MSKKTITINPELFKIPTSGGRSTRKKRTDDNGQPIPSIKVRAPKPKTNTIRSKNHVLRFIRNQQEQNYKKILGQTPPDKPSILDTGLQNFNSDFDESLKYMLSLTDEQKQAKDMRNKTLKQYSNNAVSNTGSLLFHQNLTTPIEEMVEISAPNVFNTTQMPLSIPLSNLHVPSIRHSQPQYGCLKYGGTLPTYRQLHNKTQRRMPQQNTLNLLSNTSLPKPIQIPSVINPLVQPLSLVQPLLQEQSVNTQQSSTDRLQEIKKTMEATNKPNQKPRIKYPKQKRTIRRTFRVGKSKVHPKISVLVSNRTLRNNITTKSQLLKQTSIPEIKRFLIKKGFIKVGSSAPNDVLRKMYETASMICGEIQNHNPENLLYNYFNDLESTP
jgi:hypothetical protein